MRKYFHRANLRKECNANMNFGTVVQPQGTVLDASNVPFPIAFGALGYQHCLQEAQADAAPRTAAE